MSIFWRKQETDQAVIYKSKMKGRNMYLIPIGFLVLGIFLSHLAFFVAAGVCVILFFLFCLMAGFDNWFSIQKTAIKLNGFRFFPKNKISKQNVDGHLEITINK